MTQAASFLSSGEIERLSAVLGQAAKVSYAPPNIYPMSAPSFSPDSGSERRRPAGNELGLYVHVPFCNYSCSFCFYATRLTPPPEKMWRYLAALRRELDWVEPGSRLTQLYVGGGTPTTLPPDLLDELLTGVFKRFVPRGADVHTVETSPESITPQHIAVLKSHGIERVSMGIQSLSDDVLGTVKRRHAAGQALEACDLLLQSGLLVNVDLIYGLPGQTEESFCRDLETIVERGIHSVTAYNLRINERTPVGRELDELERLDLPSLVRWRSAIRTVANRLGFEAIRWHTFRRQSPQGAAADAARRFTDVTGQGNQFGIGNGARSRLDGVVYRNHSNYDTYLNRIEGDESPVEETKTLNETERKLRFVALTIGDGKSLEYEQYQREFGCDFGDDFGEAAEKLQTAGLIEDQQSRLAMTPTGQLLYDLVTRAFYPNPVRRWLDERQELAQTAANLPRNRGPLPTDVRMPEPLSDWIVKLFADRGLRGQGHAQRVDDLNLGLGWIYYGLTRLMRPRTVVVIGSLRGFSPLVFGRAADENCEAGTVWFIDPSLVDDFWKDEHRVREHFAGFGLKNIRHVLATTQQFIETELYRGLPPVELLFVDGYHTAEQARFDHLAFADKLATGAIVLFHDSTTLVTSGIYGEERRYLHTVKHYMDELKRDPTLQVFDLPFDSGLTLVRRVTPNAA